MAKSNKPNKKPKLKWNVRKMVEAYGLDAVRAGAKYINRQGAMLRDEAMKRMAEQGIAVRSGNLRKSLRLIPIVDNKMKDLRVASTVLIDDAVVTDKNGKEIAYGRIIEFSPKINKPFFYTAYYESRNDIKDGLAQVIREKWQEGNKK